RRPGDARCQAPLAGAVLPTVGLLAAARRRAELDLPPARHAGPRRANVIAIFVDQRGSSVDLWLRTDVRICYLAAMLVVLLALESFAPLYAFAMNRWRHALPNLVLTALVIAVNLLLAFVTIATVQWTAERGIGLLRWLELPPFWALLVGILGLDLFAYFA